MLVGDEDVMPVLVRELSNAWRRSGEPSYDSASGDGAAPAPLGLALDCCGGRTRSWSGVCAKKQTRRRQAVPSLQGCVR